MQSKDFIHDYMWHPLAPELTGWQKAGNLLGTVALGVFSAGLFHLVTALVLKRNKVETQPESPAVRRVRENSLNDEEPLLADPSKIEKEIKVLQIASDSMLYVYSLAEKRGDQVTKEGVIRQLEAIEKKLQELERPRGGK